MTRPGKRTDAFGCKGANVRGNVLPTPQRYILLITSQQRLHPFMIFPRQAASPSSTKIPTQVQLSLDRCVIYRTAIRVAKLSIVGPS